MRKLRISMEILLLAALVVIFALRGFVPAWRSLNTDFPNYYVAARLYAQGDSLARVYDWVWFQRQSNHAGVERRVVGFVPLTLYSAMPIVPLTSLSPLAAKRCWIVINLLLLGFSGWLLHKMTELGPVRTAILVFLALEPLHAQFLYGQLHIVVLVLLLVALWLYLNDWPIASGAALAVASAIKIYPIFFVFYFVRKRQWRVVVGIVASCFLLAVLAIALFGVEVNRVFLEQVLPRAIRGEAIDPYSLNWNSLTALFYRLFVFEPELNPSPLINAPLGYAVLQSLIQGLIFIPILWLLTPQRASFDREKIEYGIYVAMLLVLSTNPASYHYVALIVCAVLMTDYLLREQRNFQAILFVLLYTLTSLPTRRATAAVSGPALLLSSSRLVFSLALFILLLAILTSLGDQTWSERFRSRAALVFVPMFSAMVVIAAVGNYRHIKSEVNYAPRLELESQSLLTTDPAPSEKRVAFTELQPGGYAVGILAGKQLPSFAAGANLIHPAVIPHSSVALVEMAESTSRIVWVDLNRQTASDGIGRVEVEDGERPLVSADGRWLAFIREVHGRGSLWIKKLQTAGTTAIAENGEIQLAGPEYDVLEAAFDAEGSEIIFAGQPHNGPALFTIKRTSSLITQSTFGSAARYPALSPDGQWLAYCKLYNGSWQVWLQPRHPGPDERQLTRGDCNSVSPAWTPDSKELVYATDCGRGWGLTALARIRAVP